MDIDKIKKGLNNPAKSYNYLRLLLNGFYYKRKIIETCDFQMKVRSL